MVQFYDQESDYEEGMPELPEHDSEDEASKATRREHEKIIRSDQRAHRLAGSGRAKPSRSSGATPLEQREQTAKHARRLTHSNPGVSTQDKEILREANVKGRVVLKTEDGHTVQRYHDAHRIRRRPYQEAHRLKLKNTLHGIVTLDLTKAHERFKRSQVKRQNSVTSKNLSEIIVSMHSRMKRAKKKDPEARADAVICQLLLSKSNVWEADIPTHEKNKLEKVANKLGEPRGPRPDDPRIKDVVRILTILEQRKELQRGGIEPNPGPFDYAPAIDFYVYMGLAFVALLWSLMIIYCTYRHPYVFALFAFMLFGFQVTVYWYTTYPIRLEFEAPPAEPDSLAYLQPPRCVICDMFREILRMLLIMAGIEPNPGPPKSGCKFVNDFGTAFVVTVPRLVGKRARKRGGSRDGVVHQCPFCSEPLVEPITVGGHTFARHREDVFEQLITNKTYLFLNRFLKFLSMSYTEQEALGMVHSDPDPDPDMSNSIVPIVKPELKVVPPSKEEPPGDTTSQCSCSSRRSHRAPKAVFTTYTFPMDLASDGDSSRSQDVPAPQAGNPATDKPKDLGSGGSGPSGPSSPPNPGGNPPSSTPSQGGGGPALGSTQNTAVTPKVSPNLDGYEPSQEDRVGIMREVSGNPLVTDADVTVVNDVLPYHAEERVATHRNVQEIKQPLQVVSWTTKTLPDFKFLAVSAAVAHSVCLFAQVTMGIVPWHLKTFVGGLFTMLSCTRAFWSLSSISKCFSSAAFLPVEGVDVISVSRLVLRTLAYALVPYSADLFVASFVSSTLGALSLISVTAHMYIEWRWGRPDVTLYYSPHMLACVLAESSGSASDVLRFNIRAKLNRLSSMPVPARALVDLITGTEYVAHYLLTRRFLARPQKMFQSHL